MISLPDPTSIPGPIPFVQSAPAPVPHPSTSAVPLPRTEPNKPGSSLFQRLPVEVFDRIVENMDGLMTEHEARLYREELMDERSAFVQEHDGAYGMPEFNMCEH